MNHLYCCICVLKEPLYPSTFTFLRRALTTRERVQTVRIGSLVMKVMKDCCFYGDRVSMSYHSYLVCIGYHGYCFYRDRVFMSYHSYLVGISYHGYCFYGDRVSLSYHSYWVCIGYHSYSFYGDRASMSYHSYSIGTCVLVTIVTVSMRIEPLRIPVPQLLRRYMCIGYHSYLFLMGKSLYVISQLLCWYLCISYHNYCFHSYYTIAAWTEPLCHSTVTRISIGYCSYCF